MPVRNRGHMVGELITIQPSDAQLLAAWREVNRQWFLTTFEINVERTRSWIENVNGSDDRVLLGVKPLDAEMIGVVGLAQIDQAARAAEVDHVLRGRPSARGIMSAALESLLAWGTSRGLKHITVRVFEDNPAVEFYEKVGFVPQPPAQPLKEVPVEDGSRWIPCDSDVAERHLLKMTLPPGALEAIVKRYEMKPE